MGDIEGCSLTDDEASLIELRRSKVSGCNTITFQEEELIKYGTCTCEQPSGDDNRYFCSTSSAGGQSCYAHCPSNCQCTAEGSFNYVDRANFCHGGAECR